MLIRRSLTPMYEIETAKLSTDHKEFGIVKQVTLERHNRLARHAPEGLLTRGAACQHEKRPRVRIPRSF